MFPINGGDLYVNARHDFWFNRSCTKRWKMFKLRLVLSKVHASTAAQRLQRSTPELVCWLFRKHKVLCLALSPFETFQMFQFLLLIFSFNVGLTNVNGLHLVFPLKFYIRMKWPHSYLKNLILKLKIDKDRSVKKQQICFKM